MWSYLACASCAAQRVVFKIASLVHWSLYGNAPGYLADDCQLVADARVRQLRSVDTRTLVVSRTCSSFGDTTFFLPQVWNSLPPNLRLGRLSYGQFRRLLKLFLFGQWGHGAVWTVSNCAEYKYTYLNFKPKLTNLSDNPNFNKQLIE